MKKTIITLLALAGVAAAAEPITLGSWFTDSSGTKQITVDAIVGLDKNAASNLDGPNGFQADGLSGINVNTTFSIYTGELFTASTLQQGQMLKVESIVLASNSTTNSYADGTQRTLSITLNSKTYTSDPISFSRTEGFGTMTYAFKGDNAFSFELGDTLFATLNAINGQAHTAYGAFKGQTGVSNLITPANFAAWQPAVKLNVVPEPTTATLSLLALAGLAVRRRRK